MDMTRSVLVVDDDDAIRTLISRVLRRAQYDVTQASNGSEALTELRQRPIHTVVLDLMMPVMSGFELVDYLDHNDDAGCPCVIVVSAAGERDLQSVSASFVHAVLRKPFNLEQLLDAVSQCTEHVGGIAPAAS
jgi:CheY-like chemotaxis protein